MLFLFRRSKYLEPKVPNLVKLDKITGTSDEKLLYLKGP
jgi:hypothetical protein